MLLPLDSPHWNDLTACYSTPRAIELLREIVSTGRLGEAWGELHDEIIHQGTVYGATSAALPHLIRLAPSLTPDEQRQLWIDVAFLIVAGADEFDGNEPVPGMQETLTQSLRDAEPLALQAFLDSPPLEAGEASYYALACVARSGHTVGDQPSRAGRSAIDRAEYDSRRVAIRARQNHARAAQAVVARRGRRIPIHHHPPRCRLDAPLPARPQPACLGRFLPTCK